MLVILPCFGHGFAWSLPSLLPAITLLFTSLGQCKALKSIKRVWNTRLHIVCWQLMCISGLALILPAAPLFQYMSARPRLTQFNGTIGRASAFTGDPSPELDAVWGEYSNGETRYENSPVFCWFGNSQILQHNPRGIREDRGCWWYLQGLCTSDTWVWRRICGLSLV